MKNQLVEARKQAEQAVRDMPDGDLKVKAFETILNHLLSISADKSVERSPADRKSPSTQQMDSTKAPSSLTERILSLKNNGFFAAQRSIADIRHELKKHGWHYPVTSLSGALQSLVQKRALRRELAGDERGRKAWRYSNP
ncbi:MAG: hypothetical protein WCE23_17660 [Candidatus Binatus sp.]|uniref:hypothetical protein n=1 Tax=Candidatus Binatus sp. TaxID=2811406 RepID=UPI003C755850